MSNASGLGDQFIIVLLQRNRRMSFQYPDIGNNKKMHIRQNMMGKHSWSAQETDPFVRHISMVWFFPKLEGLLYYHCGSKGFFICQDNATPQINCTGQHIDSVHTSRTINNGQTCTRRFRISNHLS